MNYPIIEGQKSEIPISESGIFLIKKKTKNAKKKKVKGKFLFSSPRPHESAALLSQRYKHSKNIRQNPDRLFTIPAVHM